MSKLLLIEARDGALDTSMHETRPSSSVARLSFDGIGRVLLRPFLHKMALMHMSSHPWRSIVESHELPGAAVAHPLNLEYVLANIFNTMERWSDRDAPIEVKTAPVGNLASIVLVDHHRWSVERELDMWNLRSPEACNGGSHAETPGPQALGLAQCREIIEAMGGEVWSAPRRDGSALVLTVPRVAGRGRLLRLTSRFRKRRRGPLAP